MAATLASLMPAAAATPPAGLETDFDHPPSRAKTVYIVMSVCLGLVTLLVAVRIYTRARISKPLWWDDCEFAFSYNHLARGRPALVVTRG